MNFSVSNGPKWVSSWLNFKSEVMNEFSFVDKIELEDWTLQADGEETPGIVFTMDEALAIARKLDEVGVPRIVTGVLDPVFPEDMEIVRKIAHLGLNAKVGTVVESTRADVDRALKNDVWGVHIRIKASDFWLEERLRSSRRREEVDRAIEAITYAKSHGLDVTINFRDAMRADWNFMKEAVTAISTQTKADTLRITDPYGLMSPPASAYLIRMLRKWTRLPIAVHCHNDFGLATANALACLSAGASIVNITVNGIGERCGLTSLEEVAVALRILYNIDVGIKYEKLCELSKLVETATGPLISKLKPIVGERAFAWELNAHIPNTSTARLP